MFFLMMNTFHVIVDIVVKTLKIGISKKELLYKIIVQCVVVVIREWKKTYFFVQQIVNCEYLHCKGKYNCSYG